MDRVWIIAAAIVGLLLASPAESDVPAGAGPYNVAILPGGIGTAHAIAKDERLTAAAAGYTFSAWVRPAVRQAGETALMMIGDGPAARVLLLDAGRLTLHDGSAVLRGPAIAAGRWTHVAAVSTGTHVTLYIDGRVVASGTMDSRAVSPVIAVAPAIAGQSHFGGRLAEAAIDDVARSAEEIAALARARPDFDLVQF